MASTYKKHTKEIIEQLNALEHGVLEYFKCCLAIVYRDLCAKGIEPELILAEFKKYTKEFTEEFDLKIEFELDNLPPKDRMN